ncbi:MAG: hypothetical protein P8R38_05485, partial [Planctomycetota bacterium]|nr:hypothetical protein [Planctomycetota bacterium]
HSHDHSHGHSHVPKGWGEDGGVRFRDLLALGLSGGIVPCPAGFTILLVAAHFQALPLGIVILIFFSMGLGVTLIGIGTLLTLGKEGVIDRMGVTASSPLIKLAPVFSALVVAGVGFWFTWQSFSEGQEVISQMLRSFANWLDS